MITIIAGPQKRSTLRYLVAPHLGKKPLDRHLQRAGPVRASWPFPDMTYEIVKAPRDWFEIKNRGRCHQAINTSVHHGKPALPDIASVLYLRHSALLRPMESEHLPDPPTRRVPIRPRSGAAHQPILHKIGRHSKTRLPPGDWACRPPRCWGRSA